VSSALARREARGLLTERALVGLADRVSVVRALDLAVVGVADLLALVVVPGVSGLANWRRSGQLWLGGRKREDPLKEHLSFLQAGMAFGDEVLHLDTSQGLTHFPPLSL
jgi:hypothetical protein